MRYDCLAETLDCIVYKGCLWKVKKQNTIRERSKNITHRINYYYCTLAAMVKMNCYGLSFRPRVSSYYSFHSLWWEEDCVFVYVCVCMCVCVCVLSRSSPFWIDSRESPPILLTEYSPHKSVECGSKWEEYERWTRASAKSKGKARWDGMWWLPCNHTSYTQITHTHSPRLAAVSQL